MQQDRPPSAAAGIAVPTGRRSTIVDVAKAAGVSPTTVSHAFNGRRHVDPETRERIKLVARELGYRPNLRAQRLRTKQAGTIALLSSMPFAVAAGPSRLGFLMEIAAVAAGAALSSGLALVLVPPLEATGLPLDSLDIDGAIVVEPTADDPHVALLQERGLPVVAIGRQAGAGEGVPFVDLHSAYTARLLLEHLRMQGAREVALVVGSQRRNSYVETEAVYAAFTATHGCRPAVLRIDENGGEAAARASCARLLAERPGIDGICAPVDAFAVGAIAAARDLGRRLPEDLKLVTRYDGLRARNAEPPITAVNLFLDEIAERAVALLFEHLTGSTARRSVAGPLPELVVRASSAEAPRRVEDGGAIPTVGSVTF
jgi:DNA-binding LacI/PurR family transcriptional regulator